MVLIEDCLLLAPTKRDLLTLFIISLATESHDIIVVVVVVVFLLVVIIVIIIIVVIVVVDAENILLGIGIRTRISSSRSIQHHSITTLQDLRTHTLML